MKKVLSILNSSILNSSILTNVTESWLSFSSVFVDLYPKCIILSVVGLLFLSLRYLILKPFLPTQTSQGTRKQQGRAKRERRTSFKEFRSFHGEAQERRKLQSIVQSPCGRLYDPSYFRRVLCHDPCCDVCNGATVKVRRLLSWASLEDCSASASSMASTASVTENSFSLSSSLSPSPSGYQFSSFSLVPPPPPPSILSTNKLASLEDILLGTPQGDPLPSESILTSTSFPLHHLLPHPVPTSPSEAQLPTRPTEGPLRPENILSLAGSHGDRFLHATTSKDACDDLPESYQQQNGAQNSCPSQLKCLVNAEIPNHHSSEDFWQGQASPHFTVPENLLKILERQEDSQADVPTLKDGKREAKPFQKELAVWEKKTEPTAALQNSRDPFPLGSTRALLSKLNSQPGLVQVQTPRGQLLEAMPTQHFWGLPYLHSESMSCITTLSSHCSSMCIWFNRTTDSPALAPPSPLPLPERKPQTPSQSQSTQLATPQAQLQTVPEPSPSSQSQVRVCGVYFRRSQETKTLLQSEIHHLEYNVMAKEPDREWALPAVVQKPQGEICLPPSKLSLAIQSSKIQPPRSVSPKDFPLTDGFQKKFEQHLRKRLILQRWGLPQGIYKSQLWWSPDPSESSMSSSGLSGFKHKDNKGPPNTVSSQSGSPQERSISIEKKTVKAQDQTLKIIQKYLCSNSKTALDNALPSDQEINLQDSSGSLSDKPSGTSQVSQCRKKFETDTNLKNHIDETNKDQVPATISISGHRPLHFNSCVGKKENKAERQPPSDNKDEHTKRIPVSGVQQTPAVLDTTILKESEAKKPSPDVPKMSARTGPVPVGKSISCSKIVLGLQGKKMDDKHIFVSNKVSNIVKEQLGGLQPQPTKFWNASQHKSAKEADGETPKAQSTLLAGRAPEGKSDPQDVSCQVSTEEKFESESSQPIQALEPPKDALLVPDKLTHKPLAVYDQSPSRAPKSSAQVEPQEPGMPAHTLGKALKKDSPLPAKRVWPARKIEELASEAAGPEKLQPNGKSHHAQDSLTPGNRGKGPVPSRPVKAPSPPEPQFRKHVKHFFQWLSPDRKGKGQEAFLKKDASQSSLMHDSEVKGRATFPGNTVAQKATRDFGKVPKEQPGHRHGAADTMRPRAPSSPPSKPMKTKPKKDWVPTDPVLGRQFHSQASLSKVPGPRSHNQAAAAFVGQKRGVAEMARQSQKCEALQPRPPVSHKESELHQNLLSRAGKVPRGTPPFAVGTMLADMSRLCEQKILAQNFTGKGLVPQKSSTS
ncbi:spermatogenesis-associated protein 31D3-like isoform X2 [Mastomys coucha]|uniref:spermatogenesis-associated protein 31D3-like isoform X2 n=1 Tax=Mastomys coucha TaxID=35658 RepID=UPI001261B86C|nr:spermatogenesis-associated protein 31D3-like isoform X2 [Mastomys coucha]